MGYDPEDYEREAFDSSDSLTASEWLPWALAAALLAIALLAIFGGEADAHQATNAAGDATGWTYERECCNSAATSPTGDCAPIDGRYVTEQADGYHVALPAGAHPKLKSRGYSAVVPYTAARRSKDFEYHICLASEGSHRYCFYAAPGAM